MQAGRGRKEQRHSALCARLGEIEPRRGPEQAPGAELRAHSPEVLEDCVPGHILDIPDEELPEHRPGDAAPVERLEGLRGVLSREVYEGELPARVPVDPRCEVVRCAVDDDPQVLGCAVLRDLRDSEDRGRALREAWTEAGLGRGACEVELWDPGRTV